MGEPSPQDALEALRRAGARRLDPVRFRYLEALCERAARQPGAVRQVLQRKLQSALSAYAERFAHSVQAAGPRPQRQAAPPPTPLAALNAYIRGATAADASAAPAGEPQQPDELKSVRRFRRAWSRSRTQERVQEASARKPANAGPLNSHVLVLQSLALMRELSPDYLRHFLAHVESLQWLEQARAKYPRASAKQGGAGKPARGTRTRKQAAGR
jgi:hypothetical protein